MPPSLSGTELKKKWRLGRLLGSGGCAQVFEVADLRGVGGEELVAKVAPLPSGLPPAMSKGKKRKKTDQEKHADMLYYEYTLYNGYLREHGGVPKAILPGKWSQELLDALSKLPVPHGGYGDDQNLRFLIMSRLGPDVDAARAKTGPWPLPRQAGYGRQMLSLLRTLHERCKMVFVDVKPENFMFGLPGTVHEDKIFLIDFGLSERYTGPGGAIKPQKTSSQVAGTPEFLSLRCHAGAGAGRCDDLESLGYVIIAMMRGGSSPLPWSGTTSVAEGLKNKRATTLEDVCRGIPGPMLRYMNLVRGMAYEDTPEYDALDSLLQEIETSGEVSAMPPVPSRTRDGSGDQRRGAVGSNDESDAIRQVNPKGRGKGKGSTKTTTSAAAAQRPEHADESMRTRPRRGEAAKSGGKGIEEAGAASTEDVAEVIEVSDVMGEAAGKGRSVGSRRRAAKGAAASPKTRKTRDGAGLAAARDTTSLVSPPLEDSANFSSDQRKARSSSRRGTGAKEDTGSSASGSHGSRVKRRAAPRKRVRDGDESDRDGDGGGSSSNREEDGGGEEVDEVAGDGGAGQSGDDTDGFFDAREQIKDGEKDGAEVGLVDGGGCATGRGNREARRAARNTRKSEIEAAVATESRSKKGRSDSKESHKYRLEVLTGPHKGDSLLIPATGTEVRVGRGAPRRNGLRLDRDMEVSDRHSVLRVSADWVMCEDVGSLNGTFVNEDKLEGPSKVVAGDVLQFGQSAVRICVV